MKAIMESSYQLPKQTRSEEKLAGYSPETFQRLLEYNTAHLLHRGELERSFQRLETKLNEENIPYFVMKGGEIAQFYPVPVLRSSSDVDMLVHTEHQQRIYDILTSDGFEGTAFDNHEWGFYKGDTHFEVHNHLIFDDGLNTKESVAFCDRCWEYAAQVEGSSRYRLDWSFHFVYLLLHMRKHIIYEGIGIRQFFDLAVLAKELRDVIDWNWVKNTLDELNLMQFGTVSLTLCEKWFDVANPFGKNTMTDAFFEQATDTVTLKMKHLTLMDKVTPVFDNQESLKMRFCLEVEQPVQNVQMRLTVRTETDVAVGTSWAAGRDFLQTGEVTADYEFPLNLLVKGHYYVSVGFYCMNDMGRMVIQDHVTRAFRMEVLPKVAIKGWSSRAYGNVQFPDMK